MVSFPCAFERFTVWRLFPTPGTVKLYESPGKAGGLPCHLQIELCFLPPYSPNLNLIERLWKFVKKQCLSSTYYADFTAFKTAIAQCLAQTQTTHRTALDSWLTFRFSQKRNSSPRKVYQYQLI